MSRTLVSIGYNGKCARDYAFVTHGYAEIHDRSYFLIIGRCGVFAAFYKTLLEIDPVHNVCVCVCVSAPEAINN